MNLANTDSLRRPTSGAPVCRGVGRRKGLHRIRERQQRTSSDRRTLRRRPPLQEVADNPVYRRLLGRSQTLDFVSPIAVWGKGLPPNGSVEWNNEQIKFNYESYLEGRDPIYWKMPAK